MIINRYTRKLFKPHLVLLIGILLIGGAIRLYKLSNIPPALHGDESGTGYNAYALLTTGKDEYANPWPLTFRNDFSPLIFYLTIPFVATFGLTEFATRFPSLIAGLLTLVFIYLVVQKQYGNRRLALLASFLVAFSTWHVRSSRLGLEMIWALVFQLLGIYLLVSARPFNPKILIFAFAGFCLSLLSYQSAKMTTPILVIALIFLYFRRSLTRRQILFIAGLFVIFIISPIAVYFLVKPVNEMRIVGISIFTLWHAQLIQLHATALSVSSVWILVRMLIQNYFQHFNPQLLFLDNSQLRYYQLDSLGLFYPWQFIFIILGLYYTLRHVRRPENKFLLLWILVAPIPAALTSFPLANIGRALLLYPGLEILCAIGFMQIFTFLIKRNNRFFINALTAAIATSGIYYYLFLNSYFNLIPEKYAQVWGTPLKSAIPFIIKNEAGFAKIIITNTTRQSYMYFLFYGHISPEWLLNQDKIRDPVVGYSKINKFEFRVIDWEKDAIIKNALLVGTPEELPATGKAVLFEYTDPLSRQTLLRAVKT